MTVRSNNPEKHGNISLDITEALDGSFTGPDRPTRYAANRSEALGRSPASTLGKFLVNARDNFATDLSSNQELTYSFLHGREHYHKINPIDLLPNRSTEIPLNQADNEFNPDFEAGSVCFKTDLDLFATNNRGNADDGVDMNSRTPNLKYPNTENNVDPLFGEATNSEFGSQESSISKNYEDYQMITSRYTGN